MAGFVVMDITQEDYDRKIRNKAIDEFVEKAWRMLGTEDRDIYCVEVIDEIADQMKGGAE